MNTTSYCRTSILLLLLSLFVVLALPSVLLAQTWKTEVVVDGLENPWSIAWLPDSRMLISERAGRLNLIDSSGRKKESVTGVPQVFASGQGGLLEVSLHPEFSKNKWVYLTYSKGSSSDNRTAVGRGRLEGTALLEFKEIFEVSDGKSGGQHFGSRIVWLPDNTFLLSIGDGGNPPTEVAGTLVRNLSQDTAHHFGKVLRLDDQGKAPKDNPFLKRPKAAPEVWSMGHRNIQGMVRDPKTGVVWANEHGARGGDELNIIEPGENYGWPLVTFSKEYWGPDISDETSRPGMKDPVVQWTPSNAPSGLALYSGARFPDWEGNLFSGALKFKQIIRLKVEGAQVSTLEEMDIGKRVRDVRLGPDEYLYVLTDQESGELLRIVPKS